MSSEYDILQSQVSEAYALANNCLQSNKPWIEILSDSNVTAWVDSEDDPTWNIKVEGRINKSRQQSQELFARNWNHFQMQFSGVAKSSEVYKEYPDGSQIMHEVIAFTDSDQELYDYHTSRDGEEVIAGAYLPGLPDIRPFKLNFLWVTFTEIESQVTLLRTLVSIVPAQAVTPEVRRHLVLIRANFYSKIVEFLNNLN